MTSVEDCKLILFFVYDSIHTYMSDWCMYSSIQLYMHQLLILVAGDWRGRANQLCKYTQEILDAPESIQRDFGNWLRSNHPKYIDLISSLCSVFVYLRKQRKQFGCWGSWASGGEKIVWDVVTNHRTAITKNTSNAVRSITTIIIMHHI